MKTRVILVFMKNVDGGKLSPITREALRKMDPLTLVVLIALPPTLIKNNLNPYTHADIYTSEVGDVAWRKVGKSFSDWKRVKNVKEITQHHFSENFNPSILIEDDFFGSQTCLRSLIGKGVTSTFIFPMMDKTYFASNEVATQIRIDFGLVTGRILPEPYKPEFHMKSDEEFSRIFFNGIACPLMTAPQENPHSDLGPFIVDMGFLYDLEVRPGFRRYGARVHFNQDQQVSAIYDYQKRFLFKPGSDGWEAAKFFAKVNAFLLVTAREHLIQSHFIMSNTMTRESTLELPPSHPIRRLLTIFTFRTTNVNWNAFSVLAPKDGLLHRATGLEYDSMRQLFGKAYESSKIYQPFPDWKVDPAVEVLSDNGKFPYLSEGIEYYNIVQKFVSDWIDKSGDAVNDVQSMAFYENVKKSTEGQAYELPEYTSKQNMVDLITQHIFTVTAFHELVGGVVAYIISTDDRAGFRVVEDEYETRVDLQSFLLAMIIGATTSVRMPQLMNEFKDYFGAGGAPGWERDVWNNFLVELEEQSRKVQDANASREVKFKYFDPAVLECSISV